MPPLKSRKKFCNVHGASNEMQSQLVPKSSNNSLYSLLAYGLFGTLPLLKNISWGVQLGHKLVCLKRRKPWPNDAK